MAGIALKEKVQGPVTCFQVGAPAQPVWVKEVRTGGKLGVSASPDRGTDMLPVILYGLDAPGLSQDYGPEARYALQQMVRATGPKFMLKVVNLDQYGQLVGVLYPPGGNPYWSLNFRMARGGHARWFSCYPGPELGLADAENEARQEEYGLWNKPLALRPWDSFLPGVGPAEPLGARMLSPTDAGPRSRLEIRGLGAAAFLGMGIIVIPGAVAGIQLLSTWCGLELGGPMSFQESIGAIAARIFNSCYV